MTTIIYRIRHTDGRWRTMDSLGMPDWTPHLSESLGFTLRVHADAFAADDPEDVRIATTMGDAIIDVDDAAAITAADRYRYLRDVAYYDTEVLCVVNDADYGDGRIPKGGMRFLNGKPLDDAVDAGIRLARARGRFE